MAEKNESEIEPARLSELEEIKGLGDATLEKLHVCGIYTVEGLATCTVNELEKVGIESKTATKIIAQARDQIDVRFIPGDEYDVWRKKNIWRLKTNIPTLDDLLGGGLESQTFTEFYGEFGTGKSMLAHQLAVEATRQTQGSVLYIDTENGFRTNIIAQLAKALNLDPAETLKRITIAESYNSDHQILIMEKSDRIIKEQNVKLLIIDSLMGHFRSEFIGREMLAERQQKLNYHLSRIQRYAKAFNFCVYVTNQVHARPDAFFSSFPAPVGGYILSHSSHYRVWLRTKSGTPIRIARLVVAPDLPEGSEVMLQITGNGIQPYQPPQPKPQSKT